MQKVRNQDKCEDMEKSRRDILIMSKKKEIYFSPEARNDSNLTGRKKSKSLSERNDLVNSVKKNSTEIKTDLFCENNFKEEELVNLSEKNSLMEEIKSENVKVRKIPPQKKGKRMKKGKKGKNKINKRSIFIEEEENENVENKNFEKVSKKRQKECHQVKKHNCL